MNERFKPYYGSIITFLINNHKELKAKRMCLKRMLFVRSEENILFRAKGRRLPL